MDSRSAILVQANNDLRRFLVFNQQLVGEGHVFSDQSSTTVPAAHLVDITVLARNLVEVISPERRAKPSKESLLAITDKIPMIRLESLQESRQNIIRLITDRQLAVDFANAFKELMKARESELEASDIKIQESTKHSTPLTSSAEDTAAIPNKVVEINDESVMDGVHPQLTSEHVMKPAETPNGALAGNVPVSITTTGDNKSEQPIDSQEASPIPIASKLDPVAFPRPISPFDYGPVVNTVVANDTSYPSLSSTLPAVHHDKSFGTLQDAVANKPTSPPSIIQSSGTPLQDVEKFILTRPVEKKDLHPSTQRKELCSPPKNAKSSASERAKTITSTSKHDSGKRVHDAKPVERKTHLHHNESSRFSSSAGMPSSAASKSTQKMDDSRVNHKDLHISRSSQSASKTASNSSRDKHMMPHSGQKRAYVSSGISRSTEVDSKRPPQTLKKQTESGNSKGKSSSSSSSSLTPSASKNTRDNKSDEHKKGSRPSNEPLSIYQGLSSPPSLLSPLATGGKTSSKVLNGSDFPSSSPSPVSKEELVQKKKHQMISNSNGKVKVPQDASQTSVLMNSPVEVLSSSSSPTLPTLVDNRDNNKTQDDRKRYSKTVSTLSDHLEVSRSDTKGQHQSSSFSSSYSYYSLSHQRNKKRGTSSPKNKNSKKSKSDDPDYRTKHGRNPDPEFHSLERTTRSQAAAQGGSQSSSSTHNQEHGFQNNGTSTAEKKTCDDCRGCRLAETGPKWNIFWVKCSTCARWFHTYCLRGVNIGLPDWEKFKCTDRNKYACFPKLRDNRAK